MTCKPHYPELTLRPYLPSDNAVLACWYGEAASQTGWAHTDRKTTATVAAAKTAETAEAVDGAKDGGRRFSGNALFAENACCGEPRRSRSQWDFALGGQTLAQALPALTGGFPGVLMLVAEEGRPVGFLSAEVRAASGGRTLWIRVLLIDPALRRRGYGSSAVSRLISLCRGVSPLHRILLAVDADNTIGLAFWQALGFSELRRMSSASPAKAAVCILARDCPHP